MELLGRMGVRLVVDEKMNIEVDSSTNYQLCGSYELVKPCAHRYWCWAFIDAFGEAHVSLPGGCASARDR